MKSRFNLSSARMLVEDLLALDYFCGESPAIPYIWLPGQNPLTVVLGENAGGKSFFRRLVQIACKKSNVECMALSMEGRRSAWVGSAFIYGSEAWQATGSNSALTVETGIRTCRERKIPHVIFWDEPDLGLSDSWAASAGQEICKFVQSPPEHTRAVFVATHSKALARELLPAQPHYLYLGSLEGPPNFTEWLIERRPKPRPLSELREESLNRFKAIQRILDKKE